MMSNFLFGVAFERLLFSALNRYLLKNSSSIETEMRSLILPLYSTLKWLALNIYHYTLEPTPPRCFSRLWKPAAISGTPWIPCVRSSRISKLWALTRALGNLTLVTSTISALTVESLLRRQNAREANRSSHALRSLAILVRALPVNRNLITDI